MIAGAIACFFAVLVWDVATDYRKWLRGKPVRHTKEAIIRSVLLVPAAVFFVVAANVNWVCCVAVVAMVGFNYWNLFDGFYNVLRGYRWFFTGSNDYDDAKTDNFLQSIPMWLHVVIKLSGSVATIFIYIKFIL